MEASNGGVTSGRRADGSTRQASGRESNGTRRRRRDRCSASVTHLDAPNGEFQITISVTVDIRESVDMRKFFLNRKKTP